MGVFIELRWNFHGIPIEGGPKHAGCSSDRRGAGSRRTPMAVLVDVEGRIASPVAAGAREVLALAGGQGEPHRARR